MRIGLDEHRWMLLDVLPRDSPRRACVGRLESPSRRPRLVAVSVGVAVLTCAAAAPAVAAPRLRIVSVSAGHEFGHGQRCFSPGTALRISGHGFAARSEVRIGRRRFRTDRQGAFGFRLQVEAPRRAQQRVNVSARQLTRSTVRGRVLRATVRYWSAIEGVDVPGWNGPGTEATAQPGKVEHARFGGFDHAIGRPLYVHYLLDGRPVFAQRVGRLRGPCGAADFRLVQFNFSPVEAGVYRVDFGTRPAVNPDAGAGYRAVRVGAAPPPLPPVTTPLFTVAGNGGTVAAPNGAAATASGLRPGAVVSARADGGFFVTDRGRVRAVDSRGRITTVAGTGTPGSGGDGGPAQAAQVNPSAVAALADGGFLIGQCDPSGREFEDVTPGRVRRVHPDGTITTIAGTGRPGRSRDGMPATATGLSCPLDVTPTLDGGVLISEGEQVRAVGPDGILKTIAGTGELPPRGTDGGPARRTPLEAYDLAVLADGSTLIADGWACRVYRLAGNRLTVVAGDGSEGRRSDDGARAVDASVCPNAVVAAPGGGFYVVDNGFTRVTGSEPRLRYVTPDGRIVTVAGTGRFSPDPSRWDELRGDGMPGPAADLRHLLDVAVLSDGGIVFSEGGEADEGRSGPGLIRYLPPASGPMLAVGLRRDRDRIFAPGRPAFTTVSLTAPAEVTVTVKHGDTVVTTSTHKLIAGDARIELPALATERYTVELSARDANGRVAADRAAIQPRGWLAWTLARSLADALVFSATDVTSYGGNGVGRCRRFAPGRIDCGLLPGSRHGTVLTIRLASGQQLRWGTYRLPIARHRRLLRPLQALRKRDYSCEAFGTSCPPPLFGRIADRWLVPWD